MKKMPKHLNTNRASRKACICGKPTVIDLLELKTKVDAYVKYYRQEEPCHQHPNAPGDHMVRTYRFWSPDEEPEYQVWSSSLPYRHDILDDLMNEYGPSSYAMVEEPKMLIAIFDQVIVVIE